jgi:hypothetical protein
MLIHHFLPHALQTIICCGGIYTTTAAQNVAALFAFMFAAAMITGFG